MTIVTKGTKRREVDPDRSRAITIATSIVVPDNVQSQLLLTLVLCGEYAICANHEHEGREDVVMQCHHLPGCLSQSDS